jgi:hypothetical protein
LEEKQVTLALKAKAEQALLEARKELKQKKITEDCHSNMNKVLRINAEKERDKLNDDKRKLEYIVPELLTQKHQSMASLGRSNNFVRSSNVGGVH